MKAAMDEVAVEGDFLRHASCGPQGLLVIRGLVLLVIRACMTPRPFYRWKSLWFGIFVASFVVGAWWDSIHFHSEVTSRQIRAINEGGGITLERDVHRARAAWLEWMRYDLAPDPRLWAFEGPLFVRGGGMGLEALNVAAGEDASWGYHEGEAFFMRVKPRENWLLFIPHWLVLIAFVAPWSGFLIWRVRRMKRRSPASA
jgi:hypothetical protein